MRKNTPSAQGSAATSAEPAATPLETPATPSYESAVSELERLVQDMESSQLPLDRLLEGYQRGAQLLTVCRARLDAVEQQVKILEGDQLKAWGNEA